MLRAEFTVFGGLLVGSKSTSEAELGAAVPFSPLHPCRHLHTPKIIIIKKRCLK